MDMTLVMDGVRRTGLVIPTLMQPVRRNAPVAPVVSASTYRVGMDGIRRSVPTPRELLAEMHMPEAMVTPTAPTLLAPALRDWAKWRQAAAFGFVATTLVATGTITAATAAHTNATTIKPAVVTAAQLVVPAAQASSATPTPAASAAAAVAPVDTGLQALLNNFVGGSSMYGVVVTNLSTGETATANGAAAMETASLYKLFVASEIYHRIDIGQLTYGQSSNDGTGRTIEQCLNAMITVSDNTCGHALGTIVGWGALNPALAADGYTATDLSGAYPQSSPADVAKLLSRLYNNTLNSPSSNDAFLALLKGQRLNAQLPTGLPTGTVIAHKTGALDGYIHDAGIVYGAKANYLVVVMSGPWGSTSTANSQFQSLSSQLWNHFEQ